MLLASVASAALSLGAFAAAEPREVLGDANITLRDAIARALEARPGQAVEAELEDALVNGARVAVFDVVVVTEGAELHDVQVDATTGKVIGAGKDEDPDATQELQDFRAALRGSKLNLVQLVTNAEAVVKGTAIAAKLVVDTSRDEGVECEVLFATANSLIEACVEGRGGKLVALEIEAAGARVEDEDEDEDGEGEDADDEGEDADEEGDDADEDDAAGDGEKSPARGSSSRAPAGPSVTPLKDGVPFTSKVTNAYFPLSTVRYVELESEDEKVVREVLDRTVTVGGVKCLVLAEKEYADGELKEISYNYFAQDGEGNVYYFGENVDDYADGKVVGHGGAWLVGRNAKEPCLHMPGKVRVGLAYKGENSPPVAEEWDEVAATDGKLGVPAGKYQDVLIVKESNHPDRWEEQKYYARGVGLISENRELNLVRVGRKGGAKKSY